MRAHIDRLNRTYAHLQTERGHVFLHQTNCDFELSDCVAGDILDVDVEETPRGLRAVWATFIERPVAELIEGTVINVLAHRAIAFMIPDDNADEKVLLHITAFTDYQHGSSPTFSLLTKGQRVRCIRRPTERGDRGYEIRVLTEAHGVATLPPLQVRAHVTT